MLDLLQVVLPRLTTHTEDLAWEVGFPEGGQPFPVQPQLSPQALGSRSALRLVGVRAAASCLSCVGAGVLSRRIADTTRRCQHHPTGSSLCPGGVIIKL